MTVGKVRREIALALTSDNKVSVREARKIVAAAVDGKVTAKEGKLIADLFEGTGGTRFTPAAKKLLGQFVVDHGLGSQRADAAQTAKRVLAEFGLSNTTVRFPQDEVDRQAQLGGSVGFEQALRQSIRSILEDGENPDSPLYILTEIGESEDPRAAVRDHLDRASTVLSIVPEEVTEADKAAGVFPPENGESVKDHWVLTARIPDLSDCLHWAVTARAGGQPTYNYGFN